MQGLTGEVRFDLEGIRSHIDIEIWELKSYGVEKVANWNTKNGMIISRQIKLKNELEDGPIEEKTFRVLSSIV